MISKRHFSRENAFPFMIHRIAIFFFCVIIDKILSLITEAINSISTAAPLAAAILVLTSNS